MSKKSAKISDKKSVLDRAKELENEEHNLSVSFRDVMKTIAGRQVIWWVLEQAGVSRQPFDIVEGELGRRLTDFNCGQLNVGNKLLAKVMKECPESYIKAMREASTDE